MFSLTSAGSNSKLQRLVDASMHPMARSWADMTFEDQHFGVRKAFDATRFAVPTGDPLVLPPALHLPPSWPSMYPAAPSPLHPASIGVFCDAARPWLPDALRIELANFLGWFLQLTVAGPRVSLSECPAAMAASASCRCWQYRLSWNQAYVLFGADVLQ